MSILPSRLRALVAALPLAAALGGCYAWSGHPVVTPEVARYRGSQVRVTRTSGSSIVLTGVTVDRDSLFGNEYRKPHGRVAIPVSDVRRVETRHVDPVATVGVTVLSTAVAFAVVATTLVHSECDCAPPP